MSAKKFDIAIVGGGVIGLSLARALAERGSDVVVFDDSMGSSRSAHPPASPAAAGMLAPSFELSGETVAANDLMKALYQFGAHSLSLWSGYAAQLEQETGLSIDYRRDGAFGIAFTAEQARSIEEQCERVTALGGDATMITGAAARQKEPALSEAVVAALLAPQDTQVDPRRLMTALSASLDRLGVVQVSEHIGDLRKQHGRTNLIALTGEAYSAEAVVIASGAFGGLLTDGLVFPVKGEAVSVALGDTILKSIIRGPGAYLCPKAGGRLVIGASEMRGRDDSAVDAAAITSLIDNAVKAVPDVAGKPEIERWAGLRPGTRDGGPILGQDKNGHFLALGHYRNGILFAPATAHAMAALITGQTPDIDIEPFSVRRF